jgi:hypothetical protein
MGLGSGTSESRCADVPGWAPLAPSGVARPAAVAQARAAGVVAVLGSAVTESSPGTSGGRVKRSPHLSRSNRLTPLWPAVSGLACVEEDAGDVATTAAQLASEPVRRCPTGTRGYMGAALRHALPNDRTDAVDADPVGRVLGIKPPRQVPAGAQRDL